MEDIIRRRKLLREKLEGKLEENSKSVPEVKSSRLHIPSIFQKGSQENLSTQTKLAVPKNLSKSTGNIHEESNLKFSLVKEKVPPIKPPRKSKSKENLTNSNQSLDSINNDHFLSSTEDLQEPKIEPVVVELRKKPHLQEEDIKVQPSEVFLRRKLSSLSIGRNSSDSSLVFNFVDKSPSPQSPVLKKLEHNPSLKRSGSRVGFIEVMKENKEEDLYDNLNLKNTKVEDNLNKEYSSEDLYDNAQLKNIPVEDNPEKELYENMEILRANKYFSKKITTGPVSKMPMPLKRCPKPEPRQRSIITC